MNAKSRLLVGLALLAVGGATLWAAATQAQSDVRYVDALLARPAVHMAGTYTLMGVPQPEEVPYTGPTGLVLAPNPRFANETRSTVSWQGPEGRLYSTHILGVTEQADGLLRWSFRNETRRIPADVAPLTVLQANWTLGRAGEAFPVVAFTPDGIVRPDTPRVWAHYGKAPEHPIQPKPSQLTGRLMATLPDGTPLPEGASIYHVETFTAGCSSKFLPPEAQKRYDDDYAAAAPS